MTSDASRRFAALLQLALGGRLFRFVEQPDRLFEIAEVQDDGRVRLKPYPMTDPTREAGDRVVEPWSLEPAAKEPPLPPPSCPDEAMHIFEVGRPRCRCGARQAP